MVIPFRELQTLTANGRTLIISNWATVLGISEKRIRERRKLGWNDAQCLGLESPPRRQRKLPRPNTLTEHVELMPIFCQALDHKAIGTKARKIRQRAGLSLAQAGNACGWSPQKMWELETGYLKWKPEIIAHFNRITQTWVAGVADGNAK